jgi:hypothetical protein
MRQETLPLENLFRTKIMTPEEIANKFLQLEKKVDEIDKRTSTIESHVSLALNEFGDYKNRNQQELSFMKGQVELMIKSIESLVITAEYQQSDEQAKSLLRKLKNNRTRIEKQLKRK